MRASAFRPSPHDKTLIVDAFDEVARIGDGRVHDILYTMRDANPDRVLLSSRSGEWEEAKTRLIKDLFGLDPQVVQLVPLDVAEQKLLFEQIYPDRPFEAFFADIYRFDLHHLLGNPEFLRLFAGAYDEADGKLPSRDHVFTLAIENLARESNRNISAKGTPSRAKRIEWANEIFSNLLLSGADGVAVGDIAEDDLHPQFETIRLDGEGPPSVLSTKLFRPGTGANQHEPVHRIVAEYGAAQYLVGRIEDPLCRLSIAQCFALIAPNGAARDDLRGLLGWMAAQGAQAIQNAAIDLDPYAILSNGDPSRLTSASRIRLLDALRQLNAEDPYFRRGDKWRSFSVSGFFQQDVIHAVRPVLIEPDEGHLRELLLELLVGSPAVAELRPELEAILLDDETSIGPRLDALSCLLSDETFEPTDVLRNLVALGSSDALRLAADIIRHSADQVPYDMLYDTVVATTQLYPSSKPSRSRTFGDRYFVKGFIQRIDNDATVRMLDDLTGGLQCTCGNDRHDCYCRNGVSKIVGMLLDSYFERVFGPHNPDQVWRWVRNLHFHGKAGANQSKSVQFLQACDGLRRALHERAFAGLTSRDDIFDVLFDVIGHYGHSGLQQRLGDARHLVDLAYNTNNHELWIQFAPSHHYYAETEAKGPDDLRRHCRRQARKNPNLMRKWAWMNRARQNSWQDQRFRRTRYDARERRRARRVAQANTNFFCENREVIMRGENVRWTHDIARAYLVQPDMLPEVTHDLFDPEVVLRKSLQTLRDRCPSIKEVGENSQRGWEKIFLAGAVAEFRAAGSLKTVAPEILGVILLDVGGYNTFADGEEEKILAEIRKWVLLTADEAEAYARAYFEPSLTVGGWSNFHLLDREPALNHLRASLPLEWLQRFPDLPIQTLETLFDMAARYGDRDALLMLIRNRCVALDEGLLPHRQEEQRPFWFLRDFWFADDMDAVVWSYMTRDPNIVFSLERKRDRGRDDENIWTPLSAPKIERVLRAYLPAWPAVPLPSSWGTGSPEGETAYRYLRDIVWQIGRDEAHVALPVVDRLLREEITAPSHNDLRSIRAALRRKAALTSSRPGPAEVAASLSAGLPASVEQLRIVVLELLEELQKDISAGHNGIINQFYDGGERLNEVRAMFPISAWMKPRLNPFDVHDVVEHQLEERNRCDLTATRMVNGVPRMLVIEGKGQWHPDLFSAAELQLADRYAMHPDADEQGIFLVVWYGSGETVAGAKHHGYNSASELQTAIKDRLPNELRGRLDVFVLDVSRRKTGK